MRLPRRGFVDLVAKAGTLLIPSGPSDNPEMMHLHIVCTDPCQEGKQLIVSVTTWRNNLCDGTCVLNEGDHPWLKHRSWVMYRAARIEASETLDNGLSQGLFSAREDMEDEVFKRILSGICDSPHTKRRIKKYFGC